MKNLFEIGKKYLNIMRRRTQKLIVVISFFPKFKGTFKNRINYFRRYINPYMNVLEEHYTNLNMNKNEKKRKMLLDIEKIISAENELYMPRLVIVLGTKCSLHCRDCNNLMPYFKNPYDLDSKKIIASIDKISRSTKSIFKCELIGGEPFIASNILQILEYIITVDSIKNIEITTNGTIIPKSGMLINVLQNPKVCVRISNYGNIVDNSNFIKFLIANNIRYEVLQLETWILPGNIDKRNKSKNTLKKDYARCVSGYLCKTLFEDKIFACARAASLYALDRIDEYISVDESFTAEEFKKFLLKDFSIACDYCDVASDNRKEVEPATQL